MERGSLRIDVKKCNKANKDCNIFLAKDVKI